MILIFVNDEDLIEVNFYFLFIFLYGQDVEQKVDNHVFNESSKSGISQ
jgi:hypothetical protein